MQWKSNIPATITDQYRENNKIKQFITNLWQHSFVTHSLVSFEKYH